MVSFARIQARVFYWDNYVPYGINSNLDKFYIDVGNSYQQVDLIGNVLNDICLGELDLTISQGINIFFRDSSMLLMYSIYNPTFFTS